MPRSHINAALRAGLGGIGAQGLVSLEMEVAFDPDPERAFIAFEFGNPHAAKLGKAVAEVAETEVQVVVLEIK
jgi:hypothetical protein